MPDQPPASATQSTAFAVLLQPGQVEASVDALSACWVGERKEAYQDARRRAGIVREAVWIQSARDVDLAIVYLEADDVEVALTVLGTSTEPFDRWFRDRAEHVHGVAWREGFTAPRLVLDFDIETI